MPRSRSRRGSSPPGAAGIADAPAEFLTDDAVLHDIVAGKRQGGLARHPRVLRQRAHDLARTSCSSPNAFWVNDTGFAVRWHDERHAPGEMFGPEVAGRKWHSRRDVDARVPRRQGLPRGGLPPRRARSCARSASRGEPHRRSLRPAAPDSIRLVDAGIRSGDHALERARAPSPPGRRGSRSARRSQPRRLVAARRDSPLEVVAPSSGARRPRPRPRRDPRRGRSHDRARRRKAPPVAATLHVERAAHHLDAEAVRAAVVRSKATTARSRRRRPPANSADSTRAPRYASPGRFASNG